MVLDRGNTEPSAPFDYENDDDSLCAHLYQSYAPGLLTYLRRHVPTQEDAEDLLLEVFIAVLKHEQQLGALSEEERRGWLGVVARNKAFDYHRGARRRRFSALEEAQGVLDEDEHTPEALLVRVEEYDQLHAYLRRLSAAQQEALQLRFTCGLRCAEIATAMNKREGAIRTMLSRALNTLRSFYEQKDKGVH